MKTISLVAVFSAVIASALSSTPGVEFIFSSTPPLVGSSPLEILRSFQGDGKPLDVDGSVSVEQQYPRIPLTRLCLGANFTNLCIDWSTDTLPTACIDFSDALNDKVSSISIAKNITCLYYQDLTCKGNAISVTGALDLADLRDPQTAGFNDNISSFYCRSSNG